LAASGNCVGKQSPQRLQLRHPLKLLLGSLTRRR